MPKFRHKFQTSIAGAIGMNEFMICKQYE